MLKLQELITEMANIRPKRTGLPMVIWIKPKTGEKHSARIKVQSIHGDKINISNWVSVTISNNPKIFNGKLSKEDFLLIKEFIQKNIKGLLQVWNDEIEPADFIENINKII